MAGDRERRVAPVLLRSLKDEFLRLHADPDALFTELAFGLGELEVPGAMIPHHSATQLVRRALALIGDAALGFRLGVRSRITHRGALALGQLASRTLGEAIALEMQFQSCAGYLVSLRAELPARRHVLVAEPRSGDHDIGSFLVDEVFTACVTLRRVLTGAHYVPMFVEMVRIRPSNAEELERYFGCPVFFGGLRNLLVTDNGWLDYPLPQASVVACRQAVDIMERETRGASTEPTTSSNVEGEILRLLPNVVSPAVLASQLHMSERSMRRRLAEQAVSYRHLLDDCRKSRALELLVNGRRSVRETAAETGFAGIGSFRRAFKRWTGSNPSDMARSDRSATRDGTR
ncbi:hypothetical protein CKO44_09370 [Rubrivivax gelatinosus]|uniref:AraC family transcriptional regulator n=1 Tax=Rubrivivax gelatinosus TaxID=28068 RepID=UPI001905F85C|nr:AraC family transcriptional regulator [Rubrivivax gelatinosus]MBK1613678.1 hypothetical protein [Rubrivivax gelatinosus]